MGTTRTFFKDATARHSVFVQRFAGGQLKEMLPYFERIKRTTAASLAGKNLTDIGRKRLNALYQEIEGQLNTIYKAMGKKFQANLKPFALYETEFAQRMLNKGIDIDFALPGRNQIYAAVFSDPITLPTDKKLTVAEILDEFGEKKSNQIIQVIKDGNIIGKTLPQIVQDVEFVTDRIQRNQAKALARQITAHISATARSEVFKQNEDILMGEEWVSTLDNRTTEMCIALDGTIFDGPHDGPQPSTLHWGCRSTRIPVVKPEYTIKSSDEFTRPAKGADGPEQDVASGSTYNSWLKTQPASFQEEVLGVQRAALFRDGGLSVKDFVDENYKLINLSELKQMEALAFEKAGLIKTKD